MTASKHPPVGRAARTKPALDSAGAVLFRPVRRSPDRGDAGALTAQIGPRA